MSRTEFDPGSLGQNEVYKLLVSALQPRPIAWVSTVSSEGIANLAPFSFATVASRDPATVLISVGPGPGGRAKDTLNNARATGCFILNVPSVRDRADVTASSTETPGSEFDLTSVTAVDGTVVAAPRVAESRMALECRVSGEVTIGSDVVLFGEVVWVHAADGVMSEALHVDNEVLDPLGRLAGPWYAGSFSALPQASGVAPLVSAGDR